MRDQIVWKQVEGDAPRLLQSGNKSKTFAILILTAIAVVNYYKLDAVRTGTVNPLEFISAL